jgi:hypothetical protein
MFNNELSIVLESASTSIALPRMAYLDNVSKMRIKSLSYVNISTNKHLILNVNDFRSVFYSDGSDNKFITAFFSLGVVTAGSQLIYNGILDKWDAIVAKPKDITFLTIDVLLDNAYSSDISASNPVNLVLQFG